MQTLWEGKTYNVETTIRFADGIFGWGLRGFAIDLTDVHPGTFGIASGSCRTCKSSYASTPGPVSDNVMRVKYQLEARELGMARFRGVLARFDSPSGMFFIGTMIDQSNDFLVAPRVFQFGSPFPLLKQDNRLSPPGIHTHRRAGSGSELLEIREYMPGDPPKSIAWKMTARRDQLMSKQLESEVPLRCTLFMDTSASTYLRADRPPVIQPFVRVASTLIEFLTASRDPVGVVTFAATEFRVYKHSASRRASLRTIRALTKLVTEVPRIDRAASNISQQIQLGLALASAMYPELHANAERGFGLQILSTLRMRRAQNVAPLSNGRHPVRILWNRATHAWRNAVQRFRARWVTATVLA